MSLNESKNSAQAAVESYLNASWSNADTLLVPSELVTRNKICDRG